MAPSMATKTQHTTILATQFSGRFLWRIGSSRFQIRRQSLEKYRNEILSEWFGHKLVQNQKCDGHESCLWRVRYKNLLPQFYLLPYKQKHLLCIDIYIFFRFAAALKDLKIWVMNVVNVDSPDTLPVIYERGLFGVYHDWCESFSTYPRTYDLLHADQLFSKLKER